MALSQARSTSRRTFRAQRRNIAASSASTEAKSETISDTYDTKSPLGDDEASDDGIKLPVTKSQPAQATAHLSGARSSRDCKMHQQQHGSEQSLYATTSIHQIAGAIANYCCSSLYATLDVLRSKPTLEILTLLVALYFLLSLISLLKGQTKDIIRFELFSSLFGLFGVCSSKSDAASLLCGAPLLSYPLRGLGFCNASRAEVEMRTIQNQAISQVLQVHENFGELAAKAAQGEYYATRMRASEHSLHVIAKQISMSNLSKKEEILKSIKVIAENGEPVAKYVFMSLKLQQHYS